VGIEHAHTQIDRVVSCVKVAARESLECRKRSCRSFWTSRRTLRLSVFHQGNRGLERDRILRERDLFLAIRGELGQASPTAPNPYRAIPAEQMRVRLRNAIVRSFPWLAEPAQPRISWIERAADFCRLLAFLFAAFLCLSIPGMAVAPVAPAWRFAVLTAVLAGWWQSACGPCSARETAKACRPVPAA
jgi:hypothetical protein